METKNLEEIYEAFDKELDKEVEKLKKRFDSYSNCYETSDIRKWLLSWHSNRKGW